MNQPDQSLVRRETILNPGAHDLSSLELEEVKLVNQLKMFSSIPTSVLLCHRLLDPTNQRLINKFIEQLGDIHANS
jgi:hypothetical protein